MPARRIVIKRAGASAEAVVDEVADGLVSLPILRYESYRGWVWYVRGVCSSTGGADALIVTGPDTHHYHLGWSVWTAEGGDLYLLEGPTVSATGTACPLVNANRALTATALSTIYQHPTISATGTILSHSYTSADGKFSQIGESGGADFWLAPETAYAFRMVSSSLDTISWSFTIVEVPKGS